MQLLIDVREEAVPTYAYTGGKPFDAALPCIVFVHGALHDHSVWTLLSRWFAHHGHSALAPDIPGHGRSRGAPLASVEALGEWLVALLQSAGIAKAVLVGHSMGSLIALEAAARAPSQVERLVMIGASYPMKVSDAVFKTSEQDPLEAIAMVNAFSHAGHAAKPSYPGPGTWLHGSNRALMRRNQDGQPGLNLFNHDFKVCDSYAAGLEAAEKVRCPVSFILGDRDQMTSPKQVDGIAKALNARVHRVPAGHNLMAEAPDAVLAALRAAIA